MLKSHRRTPRNYNGTKPTTHHLPDILPSVLRKIGEVHYERPDLILAAWPDVIGPQIAAMTQAISYSDGFLVVKVKNSTLHSLLSQNDRSRILNTLRQKFPRASIKNIVFRLG